MSSRVTLTSPMLKAFPKEPPKSTLFDRAPPIAIITFWMSVLMPNEMTSNVMPSRPRTELKTNRSISTFSAAPTTITNKMTSGHGSDPTASSSAYAPTIMRSP
jgi:hypothetical protein